MPPRSAVPPTFDYGVPTPSPSPRTPSHSRRMSHDPSREHGATSSSRRPSAIPADYGAHAYATPPQRPHTRAANHFMNSTPLHTPPPSHTPGFPYGFHSGFTTPAPGQNDYVSHQFPYYSSPSPRHFYRPRSSASAPADCECGGICYFDKSVHGADAPRQYSPFGGPQSPPPRAHTSQSNRHSRHPPTWAGEQPKSPTAANGPAPTRSRPRPATKEAPIDPAVLAKEAAKHNIPADYSLKNWDPRERPIILLGSVFDANSLGEWIFNWTKFHHGRNHNATKTAAAMWEILIDFAARLKRAKEFSPLIKNADRKEIVDDFMDSGERLWQKLKGLLKSCEEYMWRGVKNSKGDNVQMGKRSGGEFVDAMFNGEKEWEKTETLLKGMYTWNRRFDVNCEDILRRPTEAN